MKKTFKIAGVVSLSVTYMIAVSLFYGKFASIDTFINSGETTEQASYFSFPSFLVSEANLPSEISYLPVVSFVSSGSSFHFKEFSVILKINEIILTNSFVSYSFQAINFPVRLRKANLLFPFHSFW